MNIFVRFFIIVSPLYVIAAVYDDSTCSSYPIDTAVFLPDPYDCAKYYECFGGKLFVMNCPTDLYWNQKEENCDFKENVNCLGSNATTPAIGPTTTSRGTTQSNNATTEAPDPRCGAFPREELNFLADPFDCRKYYQCYEGKLDVMNCPTDLYWNQKMNYCDYKENVICSDNSTTPEGPATTRGTTIPSNSTTVGPDPICSGYPAEDVIYLPDPYDCKKYYECFGGKLFVMSCSGDLYWNQEKEVCDYQSDVSCDQGNNTTPRGNTNPDNNVTTVGPDPVCSKYPAENVTYLPDPHDCKKYYECFDGKLFVMSCSGDLYWNQEKEVCDYEYNVNCTQVPTTISTTITTTTTVRTTTPVKTTSNPDPSSTICIGKPDGTFVADPYDCSSYYECDFQRGTKQTCPLNMYWNEKILNCDYENNVNCTQSKFHLI